MDKNKIIEILMSESIDKVTSILIKLEPNGEDTIRIDYFDKNNNMRRIEKNIKYKEEK